jgi:lysine 2,3-aminomutase
MTQNSIQTAAELISAGLIPPEHEAAIKPVMQRYAVAITPAMAALIRDPGDDIGRQFVPSPGELAVSPEESADPIGDTALSPVKGIVHRYQDRVLLKPLLVCPVYCRFCFRREHVGPGGGLLTEAELQAAFAWIAARPEIGEVILTGGDPLMLSPRRLGAIMRSLAAIPHIATIRVHTRVPVADPARLTEALAAALDADAAVFAVIHANSAREFTSEAAAALTRLRVRGVPLLGQSVLLRGVNDTPVRMEALLRAMLRCRIKPYYLHQLDRAPGTAQFHVPAAEGSALLASLRGRVTGLAWPTYVLDIPGGAGKVPIGPDYLTPDGVRDPEGRHHALPPGYR